MTATRRAGLTCDGWDAPCGATFDGGGHASYDTVKACRHAARKSGWSKKGSRDLCEACTHKRGVRLRLDRSTRAWARPRGIRMGPVKVRHQQRAVVRA